MQLAFSSLWFAITSLSLLIKADIFDSILTALEHATTCAACHAVLLPPLQFLAQLGNDAFVDVLVELCQTLKLEDDDVCAGAIGLEGPLIAHALRQIDAIGTTATKFCDAVVGLCQVRALSLKFNPALCSHTYKPPPITPFTVDFPKPAPSNSTKFVSKGKIPFQVVHFSDVHIDRSYTVGSDANCTKPICCRNFADKTGAVTEPAGPFGNSKCDSPGILGQSLLHATKQLAEQSKFSIFTGDVIDHSVWLVNKSGVTSDLVEWNAQMFASLGTPFHISSDGVYEFLLVGNHESAPANSFPRNTTDTTIDSQWVFDTQSAGWEGWISAMAAEQMDHMSGSYAIVVPDTSLRPDPNGILSFIVSQLQAAEDASQRAWIIGHIPLGHEDTLEDQSNYYDQIVQRYKDTIAAQFFGHTHVDEFQIAYSDWNNQTIVTADSISFIAPALTPTSGNPAFKLYDVDPDTYEVMDAKVFIGTQYLRSNLPNITSDKTAIWELYYSARASYGPLVGPLSPTDPLDASFWHALTEVFESNDDAFQLYNARKSRGLSVNPCTSDCKTVTICDMRAARSQDNCDIPSPGLQFKRNEHRGRRAVSRNCEGVGLSHMLSSLVSDLNSPEVHIRNDMLMSMELARHEKGKL
ncbi:hypothetical protein EW146_g7480 [Bondarzewia mesenterica]|uniref:Sphingomyelin phosphodiesterase n=1 Tax=Bondarzewia mesenterica TaxID=1095465 RepID=A0A4S4LMH4_9AGAM|nr:hypothetical protein EW146_g7480 [Bondarzewia mesenterica]